MEYDKLAKNFGFRLKMVRMKKGMTQATLSEILHCQENHISDIERGKINVTLKTISKIASALGIKEEKLFNFED
jgi:transcriptional regulator with XRE-family HTH domain